VTGEWLFKFIWTTGYEDKTIRSPISDIPQSLFDNLMFMLADLNLIAQWIL
jgi:hypothetical protein